MDRERALRRSQLRNKAGGLEDQEGRCCVPGSGPGEVVTLRNLQE